MDEVLDFGYVQGTATEVLKPFIFNEPVLVDDAGSGTTAGSVLAGLKGSSRTTKPSSAVNKPISWAGGHKRTSKSEVFLDVLEKVSVLFSSTGAIQTSTIDGSVLIKSYLQGGCAAMGFFFFLEAGGGIAALDPCVLLYLIFSRKKQQRQERGWKIVCRSRVL
jgi:hypothetical protein